MSELAHRHRLRILVLVAALALGLAACTPSGPPAPPTAQLYNGYGFDACTAPSTSTMSTWKSNSSFGAIGIYIGGNSRACAQPNLTTGWISTVHSQGWKLLPLYVGSQAPAGCTSASYSHRIDPNNAAAQGAAEASDARTQAANLSLGPGTPIYFDLEAYSRTSGCSAAVKAFVDAWDAGLKAGGYLAGFYSSSASGIADQASFLNDTSYHPPDEIWFANWDGRASVYDDPYFPNTAWAGHQRHHQYQGGHNETHGGVTINIDSDYSDGAVA